MKINRMIEIITILLNKKTVTAASLAERFGVSQRTIYRDIDHLSASGIPVYTSKGINGGISIMENYTVNRTIFSDADKDLILFALNSLKATHHPEVESVLEKLGALFENRDFDWISVDFSPWGYDPAVGDKFSDIKTAVLQNRVLMIDYINAKNVKSNRKIMPLSLDFKHKAWYLRAWCCDRSDFRTFRISRIKRIDILDEKFDRRECLAEAARGEISSREDSWSSTIHLVLQFEKEALYRLFDDYDDSDIQDNGDGTYTLEVDFPEDEWVYSYILSFGTYVKVIEPEHIKTIIQQKAKNISGFYD